MNCDVISADVKTKFYIHSTNGEIQLSCDELNVCQININNQLIEEFFHINKTDGTLDKVIEKLDYKAIDGYIVSLYNGDGCPNMYFLIEVKPDKTYIKTQTFGNCNQLSSINFTKDAIQLNFPGDALASRSKEMYEYLILNHSLKRTSLKNQSNYPLKRQFK